MSPDSPVSPRRSSGIGILLLLSLCIFAAGLSLVTGPAPIGWGDVSRALLGEGDPVIRSVVMEIRLPRLILSLAVGATLALTGAALQGYLRNPLADPSVLGASGAAALGAVVALYFGLAAVTPAALPLMAIGSAVIGLSFVMALSRRADSPLTLILAGIAVGTLSGAAISLALNLSANPFSGMEITFWLLGSLEDRSMTHVALALPSMLAGCALLMWDGRGLDALALGEDAAEALGFNLGHVQCRIVAGVALAVGGAVAVSGTIGFVGLVVPHIIRLLGNVPPSRILLPSALAGAALLTVADVAVRLVPATTELRLGVVTAMLGVPFFLHLLTRRRVQA